MVTSKGVEVDVAWVLEDSFREVLAAMFGLEVEGPNGGAVECGQSLTGTIGLTGAEFQGLLKIHCSQKAARSLAAALLGGEEMLEDESLIGDSLGELANMLGGAVKQRIDQTGARIEISLPAVVEGELQAQQNENSGQVDLGFHVEGDPVRASLHYHQSLA